MGTNEAAAGGEEHRETGDGGGSRRSELGLEGRADEAAGNRRCLRTENYRWPPVQGEERACDEEGHPAGHLRQDQGSSHRETEVTRRACRASLSSTPSEPRP